MVRGNVLRGFMTQRSGDVCFVLRPGYFDHEGWAKNKGTTHGSPWNYDTHIPIVLFGKGIRAGEVLRPTAITDIAPTIAMLIGMPMPDAVSGSCIGAYYGASANRTQDLDLSSSLLRRTRCSCASLSSSTRWLIVDGLGGF